MNKLEKKIEFHKSDCPCFKCNKKLTDKEFELIDELSGVIQETYAAIGCYPNELAMHLIRSGYKNWEKFLPDEEELCKIIGNYPVHQNQTWKIAKAISKRLGGDSIE